MTNRDGAGTGTFQPLRFTAGAAVAAYAVVPISPANGDRVPATSIALVVDVSNTAGGNSDVPFELASDSGFTTIVWSTTQTNVANGLLSVIASGLTNLTKYWWRARLAPTGTTTWGPWSPVRTLTPDLNSGRGFGYVDFNGGVFLQMEPDVTSVEYVNDNVGLALVQERDVTSVEYVNENIGVAIVLHPEAVEYAYYGDVNTLTPTPHIWFLKPKSGRPGDGIRIFCFGVGDLQATFSGVVEAYWGPVLGWVTVPVINWQTFLPTSEAYTALRQLDELAEIIDMQHSVVEITVPLSALPPGMPVRIRTNGA